MRAIHIQKYGRVPQLVNCPLPIISQGQFLIKMKYAPINPSDLFFYLGLYGIRKEGFPIMGFEGSGVIQDCEEESLKGRTVSIFANKHNGTYAEYMISNPNQFIVWPKEPALSQQQISMSMVNPLSVLGMANIIEEEKVETLVLSAATSNTSKMIMKFIKKNNPNNRVIGISRSQQYDQELKKAGFDSLFRMESIKQLKQQLKNHGKAMFMDCVGGNFAGEVFNALPPKSMMVNYGRLSKQNLGSIDLGQLYYREKRIRGFWLNNYLAECGNQRLNKIKSQVIENSDVFRQKIRQVFPIDSFELAIKQSIKNQSQGKILLQLNHP